MKLHSSLASAQSLRRAARIAAVEAEDAKAAMEVEEEEANATSATVKKDSEAERHSKALLRKARGRYAEIKTKVAAITLEKALAAVHVAETQESHAHEVPQP